MRLSLYEHAGGVETAAGNRVVYDCGRGEAHFGAAIVEGAALVWELSDGPGEGAALASDLDLGGSTDWIVRCDRIDFPPGGLAYRHSHPGGGIRRLLFGSLVIDTGERATTHRPGDAWFEGPDYPVLATAGSEPTAFVRVMVLPAEWEGRRTIRYLDPADEDKPKLQRPTVFFDRRLER
jgi:hypothetical protein